MVPSARAGKNFDNANERSLLNALPSFVCVLSSECKPLFINTSFRETFNTEIDPGEEIDELELPDGLEETFTSSLARLKAEGDTVDRLLEVPVSEGESQSQKWTFRPHGDQSGADRYLAVGREVTDYRRVCRELRNRLEEKETLLEEVHHRVKNDLQLIASVLRMQAVRVDGDGTKDVLLECRDRVHTLGMIHERIYRIDDHRYVDVRHYIKDLVNFLTESHRYPGQDINCDLSIDVDSLPVDRCIPVGLVVNELVSNAIDHGMRNGEGSLEVSFEKHDGTCQLTISDDGGGIPDDFSLDGLNSLGLKLVRKLVENQLNGSFDIEQNDGTKSRVRFPVSSDP